MNKIEKERERPVFQKHISHLIGNVVFKKKKKKLFTQLLKFHNNRIITSPMTVFII